MDNEIQNRASFDRIRYANCWEDVSILIKALNINKNTNCISIASGGDNSLAILSQNPALVVAVDISQAQLACLEIKKMAFAELEYNEMLEFLGFANTTSFKMVTYKQLRKYLSPDSRTFWDNNQLIISNGIIHSGKFENYFQLFRRYILPLVHNQNTIISLLNKKCEQERIEFYNKIWNSRRWRFMFRLFFNRYTMGKLGRDSEFFKYVNRLFISQLLFKRAEYAFTTLPTHDNPYLNYILTGSFSDSLPFYVKKENYIAIRNNLDKLRLFRGSLDKALASYDIKYDAFNLSDIFEYMDKEQFYIISQHILNSATANARIVYWNMLVDRKISDILPDKLSYLQNLSKNLSKKDQAFFYKSFFVDEVN